MQSNSCSKYFLAATVSERTEQIVFLDTIYARGFEQLNFIDLLSSWYSSEQTIFLDKGTAPNTFSTEHLPLRAFDHLSIGLLNFQRHAKSQNILMNQFRENSLKPRF